MIRLEKFGKDDFTRLISWVDSEKLMLQFAGPIFTFPITIEQLDLYIADKNRYPFKAILSETGEVIGHGEVYNSENMTTKLCRILLGENKYRGKGLGKEIVNKLVEYSFGNLNASMIELNVVNWNISAIKCYERVGFVINPVKNITSHYKNEVWISHNMILNKDDWTQRTENSEI